MVGGTPLQTKDFSWHILTNWSHDKYTYHKLDPDYSTKRPWIKEGLIGTGSLFTIGNVT